MRRVPCGVALMAVCFTLSAARLDAAFSFHLYSPPGDETVVNAGPPSNPTVFQLTASTDYGYGGMYWHDTDAPLFSTLTHLSADYQWLQGTFSGGGSPRFTLFNPGFTFAAYVYWGDQLGFGTATDPNGGIWGNTGNYIGDAQARFAVGNSFYTYAQFLALYGNTPIEYVTLDLDGGWSAGGQQRMLVDNFQVNNDVFSAPAAVPEPGTLIVWSLLGCCAVGIKMWWRKDQE